MKRLVPKVKIVTEKESTYVGCCIYCGATQVKLTEEHISPYGLNGLMTLLDASCLECAKVTSKIERHVLWNMWKPARKELGYRTRHEEVSSYPLRVIQNGNEISMEVSHEDALKIIELPIFNAPAVLDGRACTENIQYHSKDTFILKEQKEELTKRLGIDEVLPPAFDPDIFARFVAKCSYGYSIYQYGIQAFESIYVQSAILGKTRDIGQWVGSPETREFRICNTPMSAGFKILPDNDLLVRIKVFPRFNGAEYITVVGKMKQFHAEQYRLVRGGREAPHTFQNP